MEAAATSRSLVETVTLTLARNKCFLALGKARESLVSSSLDQARGDQEDYGAFC